MREEAREYFKKCNLTYESINMNDLYKLISILNKYISDDAILIMMNEPIMKGIHKNIFLNKNRKIKSAFLECKGQYFGKREAISFNQDGFIGFCGWADDIRTRRITNGFKEWCDYLKNKEGEI
jgi:hypothetical protein